MTTEARNEAADYLRLGMPKPLHAKLGEALAAERRATVERIRDRLLAQDDVGTMVLPGELDHFWLDGNDVAEVLDLEAAR